MTKWATHQIGADQLKAWKAALAQQRRQQRRDRWKRPGPQITGIRIPPPSDNPREQQ